MSKETNILITGASGFLGQLLAARLLSSPQYKVTLTDIIEPPIPSDAKYPQNATTIQADLCNPSIDTHLITESLDAIYLFHGIMSAGSEANFSLGMTVNLDSTRALLESLHSLHNTSGKKLRVIYASSQAVYGQPLPDVVTEDVMPTPEGSYGTAKMICEHLINEYNRRGWIEGFALRFPTVCVRPGKPSAAASSFLSGMIREPLQGQKCVIPLKDRSFTSAVCSPRTLCENLVLALTVKADGLPPHIRHLNMPGISVTVQEMMDALEKVGGKEALDLLSEETDLEVERILRSWGTRFDNKMAYDLGFKPDFSFEEAVLDFKKSLEK